MLGDHLQELTLVEPNDDRALQLTEAFTQGVYCFYNKGVRRPYRYRNPPGNTAHDEFLVFMRHVAARRGE